MTQSLPHPDSPNGTDKGAVPSRVFGDRRWLQRLLFGGSASAFLQAAIDLNLFSHLVANTRTGGQGGRPDSGLTIYEIEGALNLNRRTAHGLLLGLLALRLIRREVVDPHATAESMPRPSRVQRFEVRFRNTLDLSPLAIQTLQNQIALTRERLAELCRCTQLEFLSRLWPEEGQASVQGETDFIALRRSTLFEDADAANVPDDSANIPIHHPDWAFAVYGGVAFRLLEIAVETGLFTILNDARRTDTYNLVDEVARNLQLSVLQSRNLIQGLLAVGLLRSESSHESAKRFIGRQSLSGRVELPHALATLIGNTSQWSDFMEVVRFEHRIVNPGVEHMASSLRSDTNKGLSAVLQRNGARELSHSAASEVPAGKTLYKYFDEEKYAPLTRVFFAYMEAWSRIAFPGFRVCAARVIGKPSTIADVGGGYGGNAIALIKSDPAIGDITVFDTEQVVPKTQRQIDSRRDEWTRHAAAEQGVVRAEVWDIFQDPPKDHIGKYDVALLVHQLVIWPSDEVTQILRRAKMLLKPGGQIIIYNSVSDDILDPAWNSDDRQPTDIGPFVGAMDNAYFLTTPSEHGFIHDQGKYKAWLKNAGFESIEIDDKTPRAHVWTPHAFISAKKPL